MVNLKVGKMEKVETLKKIAEVISSFDSKEFFQNAINLFNKLGYNTSRQSRLDKPKFAEFEKSFLEQHNDITNIESFKKKAHVEQWEKIDLLFQITDAEMKDNLNNFIAGKVENTEIYSYLFVAIELKQGAYSRTVLADITRQMNRVFSMPVLLLFKNGENLTLSIIKRRLNKKDQTRDVLEKVTLIKDINIKNPHRAHIDILFDLSLDELRQFDSVTNFAQLQNSWLKVLDSSELNKKFYKEISSWYFWAIENVSFPDDVEKNDSIRNATAIIRLLTRLIFVWFLKEKKGVIPEDLFKKSTLKKLLYNFDEPEKSDTTIYYKVILQNLFFATLSTEKNQREFRTKEWKNGKNLDFGNQHVYRYESLVKESSDWKELFSNIPFLNGGLFENLDNKSKRVMVDGFSEETRNNLSVPDFLFFSEQRKIDLNGVYNTANIKYSTKGLIEILNKYKFTIAENTPVEEEIALDPELLGKVFENLLASFNPETQSTARNQTGSFYTPREIVDYMVDESLKTSISSLVSKNMGNTTQEDIKTGLDILFAYTEEEHAFSVSEVKEIVKAISEIKILDPACGSGAFPMGILHKLTFILNKLDPDNNVWRQLQQSRAIEETKEAYESGKQEDRIERINEIEEAFTSNTSDYGRKLFLIENAIYGVDIQPIAVQISKLRFFISLIVEQDFNKEIKPLPNLETKFVAADSLIGIVGEATQDLFDDPEIEILEGELRKIRHEHFRARNPERKEEIRQKDKKIRDEIADLIDKSHGNDKRAKQLKSWNPYDQNKYSSFFDSEWMYGISDGFDVVIGNPPYVQIQKFSGKPIQKAWEDEGYKTFQKTGDIYQLFYEKGNQLLKNQGVLSFITSNQWMRTKYGEKTRKYFLNNVSILQLVDFGDSPIFENATTYTNILVFVKNNSYRPPLVWDLRKIYIKNTKLKEILQESASSEGIFSENSFIIISPGQTIIRKRIEEMGTPLKEWDVLISRGVLTGYNKAFIIPCKDKNELIAEDPKSAEIIKPILRGRDIKKYKAEFVDKWLINTHNGYLEKKTQQRISPIEINSYTAIKKYLDKHWDKLQKRQDKGITPYNLRNCAYLSEFEKEKIVWGEIVYDSAFSLDVSGLYPEATSFFLTGQNLRYLIALLNSRLVTFAFRKFYAGGDLRGETFRYKKVFLETLPIPKIPKPQQLPFEILVDCILFAKENEMETEASTFESVIDGMVYDLYFEEEMKKANCYITDRIAEVVKPFKPDDTDEFKKEYVKKLYKFCRNDKTVFRGLTYRHTVRVVKIINGEK